MVLAQSYAILRYLGRKFELYGSSEMERARIDEFLEGIAGLRKFYLELVYTHSMVRLASLLAAGQRKPCMSPAEVVMCRSQPAR